MTDIAMPGLDGLGLTANVARDFPQTRVIILSMHTEPEYADGALAGRAAGYVVKDSAPPRSSWRSRGRPRRVLPESGGLQARRRRLRRMAEAQTAASRSSHPRHARSSS